MHSFDIFLRLPRIRIRDTNEKHLKPFNDEDNKEETAEPMEQPIGRILKNNPGFKGTMPRGTHNILDASYESLDFNETSSAVKRKFDLEHVEKGSWFLSLDAIRWGLIIPIGFLTALVALSIEQSIHFLAKLKYGFLRNDFECYQSATKLIESFSWSCFINFGFCTLAAFVVYISPQAAGSGIPQVKCYLNGVKIPHLMRIKTLICKASGVVFSVLGGLAVGKEGPMIHSGAIIAAGISQGKSTSFGITTKYNEEYRHDAEKRDFVACGSAAGVAAAFGSPIGGLLFAVEEGASHFDQSMLWRVSACSILSYFSLNIIKSFFLGIPGQMSNGGLISFGEFDNAQYNFYQLPVFVLIAIVGGLSGAMWNFINEKITKFRMTHVQHPLLKWFEVASCGIAASSMAFMMMILANDCKPVDIDDNQYPVQLQCRDGESSAAAGLWYKTPEEIVRSLFHDPIGAHDLSTLVCFVVLYYFLSCWTYGMSISSGIFIPTLLTGAAWGRIVGTLLYRFFPDMDWGDVGKYSLIGASAQLSGTIRLTYSLTAIILEATGNWTYIFPVFLTVLVSKSIGDRLNEGLYDIHINLMGIPMLGWKAPDVLKPTCAKDHMNSPVRCISIRACVRDVVELLETTTHNAFPVVDKTVKAQAVGFMPSYGRLRGLVMRHDIVAMLLSEAFVDEDHSRESYVTLRSYYPRYPPVSQFRMEPEVMATKFLDFRNVMNPAPVSVQHTMSFASLYSVFRNLGLRHLIVVNLDNEVVGMITRKDIAAPITSTGLNLKIRTAKKSTILKGRQLSTSKQRRSASRSSLSNVNVSSDLPYEELRS